MWKKKKENKKKGMKEWKKKRKKNSNRIVNESLKEELNWMNNQETKTGRQEYRNMEKKKKVVVREMEDRQMEAGSGRTQEKLMKRMDTNI